jgi:hypothetical protein
LLYVVCINHVFYKYTIDDPKCTNFLHPYWDGDRMGIHQDAKSSGENWVNRALAQTVQIIHKKIE